VRQAAELLGSVGVESPSRMLGPLIHSAVETALGSVPLAPDFVL
jgi:hypothetical protein